MDLKQYKRQLQESAWLLGICENGFDDLKSNRIHWIDNGKYKGKKWFADPFILDYDTERVILFVEEFDYKVHRGRIARLIIDRKNWKVTDCKIILELDTHLSFPMIWREDGQIYVCPENYHSGRWNIYHYDAKNEKLVFVQPIIEEKLTDAILWRNEKRYYLFSTYFPTPNGKHLTIWEATCLQEQYKKKQDVRFNENIGRNAGLMFEFEGKLIRPAQESNKEYGHALVFQNVICNEGIFQFEEMCRRYSVHPLYNIGMHTFNQHPKGMAVVDVKGYRYPLLGKILKNVGYYMVKMKLKKPYVLK